VDFRFICAADTHLDSSLNGLIPYEGAPSDRVTDPTREAFRNLVKLAIEEKANFVLLAGDLFDKDWKDWNSGLFLVEQLKCLNHEGISAFIVNGNHDADSNISKSLRLPKNTFVFPSKAPTTKRIEELRVAIHGQGYARRDIQENLAIGYPEAIPGYFNIGMLHTAVAGREGHETYAPCSLGELLSKGYDTWALGHVHTREVLSEEPLVLFPGNTQGRHIRETGTKGCTLVEVKDGRIVSAEHRDLSVLHWEFAHVDVTGIATAPEVIEKVGEHLAEITSGSGDRVVAVRVIVHGSCDAHRELVAQQEKFKEDVRAVGTAEADGVWIEKVRFETKSAVDITALRSGEDPISELVKYIDGLSAAGEVQAILEKELTQLKEKLPREVFTGEGALQFEDPTEIGRLVEDVKAMLLSGILGTGVSR